MKEPNDTPSSQPATDPPQQQTHQRKLGEGAFAASYRQGFRELAGALRALPDSLPVIEEPGQINNVPSHGISQQAGYALPVTDVNTRQQENKAPNAPEAKTEPQVTSHGPAQGGESPFQSSLGQLVEKLRDVAPSRQPEKEINR